MTEEFLYLNKNKCTGCEACYEVCPVNAITMKPDHEGFLYPVIDQQLCIDCNRCISVCQIHGMSIVERLNKPILYAAKNNDLCVRKMSSSGGLFSLFANFVIEIGGSVVGVVFDKDLNIIHTIAWDLFGVNKMRGSKYAQSSINKVYSKCKKELQNGNYVLFTGTPCQIEGLNKFLSKKYDNLLTIDLLCRGVGSPLVYKDWLAFLPKKIGIDSINFRSKLLGWKMSCISYSLNGREYMNESLSFFSRLYGSHYILRPCCYQCEFNSKFRVADITLGDFWGIDKLMPDFDDDTGVSFVLCNTNKGYEYFNKIKERCEYRLCDIDSYVPFQPALYRQVDEHGERMSFWADYSKCGFKKTALKYVGKDIYHRGIRYIRRVLSASKYKK